MRRATRFLILIAYAAFVASATIIPAPPLPEASIPGLDKVAHLFLFGGLGGLGGWCVPERLAVVGVGGMAFGLLTELGQTLVPMRSFELLDLAGDAIGVWLGIALWLAYGMWMRRQPGGRIP